MKHFELVVLAVSPATSKVLGSSVDEVTSGVSDSFEAIVEETVLDTVDC